MDKKLNTCAPICYANWTDIFVQYVNKKIDTYMIKNLYNMLLTLTNFIKR